MFRAFFHYLTLAATLTHFVFGCAIHHALGDCPDSCHTTSDTVCRHHAAEAEEAIETSNSCSHHHCGSCSHDHGQVADHSPEVPNAHHRADDCPCDNDENHTGCTDDSCTFMATRPAASLEKTAVNLLSLPAATPGQETSGVGELWNSLRNDPACAPSSVPLYALCAVFLL